MDSDCSREIKRCLLLGRKATTNLGSILKSRDITLPTKVCLVKAMVFPVVMYGCESWIIKEGWVMKNWCFRIVVLKKSLESPLDFKEIKSVNLKGNQPWIFIGKTCWSWRFNTSATWWEEVIYWKRPWRRARLEAKEGGGKEWDSISNSTDRNLSKLWETVEQRGAWCAAVHGVTKSQTGLSNWTTKNTMLSDDVTAWCKSRL